jgi:hypothetical protein
LFRALFCALLARQPPCAIRASPAGRIHDPGRGGFSREGAGTKWHRSISPGRPGARRDPYAVSSRFGSGTMPSATSNARGYESRPEPVIGRRFALIRWPGRLGFGARYFTSSQLAPLKRCSCM